MGIKKNPFSELIPSNKNEQIKGFTKGTRGCHRTTHISDHGAQLITFTWFQSRYRTNYYNQNILIKTKKQSK